MNNEEKEIINNQGICPCCGEMIDNYQEIEFEGEYAYFPWHCDKCGTDGQEWYKLEFAGHNYYDENGEEIILDK